MKFPRLFSFFVWLLIVSMTCCPTVAQVSSTGLLAYYPFSGNADDVSGNGNNLSGLNYSFVKDRFNQNSKAVSFNGVDSYLKAQSGNFGNLGTNGTISFWMKIDSSTVGDGIDRRVIEKDNFDWWIFLLDGTLDSLRFGFNQGNGNHTYQENSVLESKTKLTTWNMITLTKAGSQISLFINGSLKKTYTSIYSGTNTLEPFAIGYSSYYSTQYYKGAIDEVLLFDRALSLEEINILFQPPATVSVNDIALCAGENGTLTASGCSGTINWSGGGTPGGSTLSVNVAGTYSAICTVTILGQEYTATDTGIVIVNPPITVNVSDLTLLAGTTGVLTATGCTGTITWTGGGTPNGSILLVNTAGTYTAICKVTANGRDCTASDPGVVVIVNSTNYVEFGVNNTRNPSAIFDAFSINKGVLLPRIDFNNRPTTNLVSGLLIYVIANGPQGNNCFYYYNGTAWVKLG